MKIEIWMEGFVIQGQDGGARLVDVIEADNLNDAVETYNATITAPANRRALNFGKEKAVYRDGFWSIWGCRLFDNEADARKSFG